MFQCIRLYGSFTSSLKCTVAKSIIRDNLHCVVGIITTSYLTVHFRLRLIVKGDALKQHKPLTRFSIQPCSSQQSKQSVMQSHDILLYDLQLATPQKQLRIMHSQYLGITCNYSTKTLHCLVLSFIIHKRNNYHTLPLRVQVTLLMQSSIRLMHVHQQLVKAMQHIGGLQL